MGGETIANTSMKSTYPTMAARPKGKQVSSPSPPVTRTSEVGILKGQQQIHSIYRSRLNQFTDNGQYKKQGLME